MTPTRCSWGGQASTYPASLGFVLIRTKVAEQVGHLSLPRQGQCPLPQSPVGWGGSLGPIPLRGSKHELLG
jgi:hypothetical protein